MYVLILMLLATDYHSGSAINVAEFTSKEKCEAAAQTFLSTQQRREVGLYLPKHVAICAEK
jgi:hypothetical protein